MIADNSPAAATVQKVVRAPVGAALNLNFTVWRRSAGSARASGDWYDAVAISEDTIAFTAGDLSGHGDAVAGVMAVMQASILRGIQDIRVPSEVLSLANGAAFNDGAGTIVTAFVAFLNSRQRTLTFANAGPPRHSW